MSEMSFVGARPEAQAVQEALAPLNLGEVKVQPAGDKDMYLRFKEVDEATHQEIIKTINQKFTVEGQPVVEKRFESIGPIIGKELQQKSWSAIFLAVVAIIAYIAYAFRKVSKPVASWKYGVSAVIALIHDIVIVTGIFSILGHFAGVEIDSLFITALLTILGFSVHDTIVVFDRTRENLSRHYSSDFGQVVDDSVNQTIARSINTSLTTILVLFALYFFGGQSINNFVLALIIGILFGTYSSIFVASAIVVDWNIFDRKRKRS